MKPGDELGPYRIVSLLGEGGMGQVYKARDTRLDRSVAIKVLPPEFSADPDRRARFEREAKTIAGLNHPHICTLHDVGEHDSATYLVLEHLQGETLADRLTKGPLPLEQAFTVATEIADALSAAHRQGVIHRDLKPGNVMLTKTGAKVLDFGLAKLKGHGEQAATDGLTAAPTEMRPLTGEGAIVGTLQYMAPEQVEGKPADARTDLWALGTILHEMLAGKPAFAGTSAASLIGNIMNSQPPALTTLQPMTPPALDALVRQCLSKAPEDRPDTAHDVAYELRWMRGASGAGAPGGTHRRRRTTIRIIVTAAAGLVPFAAGAGVTWWLHSVPANLPPAYLSLNVRPADELNGAGMDPGSLRTPGGSRTAFNWTPDGQALEFVGVRNRVRQIYLRRLEENAARPIPGTEGAQVPAVSPDGRAVAFWARGSVKTVSLDGTHVTDVAPDVFSAPEGLAWDDQGTIYFAFGQIWAVSPGDKPRALTSLGTGDLRHTLPALLPNARALLYTSRKTDRTWGTEEIVAQPLPAGDRHVVLTNATDARYVPQTGHLVFLRQGNLWAVPFDVESLRKRGREVQVLDGVVQALTAGDSRDVTGAGHYAISPSGTLAWLQGPPIPLPTMRLISVDRGGSVSEVPAVTKNSLSPVVRMSPDGHRLAVTVRTMQAHTLWVFELSRGTPTRLSAEGGDMSWPSWTRDSQRLAFVWMKDGRVTLRTQRADGAGQPHVWPDRPFVPSTWVDDRTVIGTRDNDIVVAEFKDSGPSVRAPWPTPDQEWSPDLSPDGKCLAYSSNANGPPQVYSRSFPGPGEPVKVSSSYAAGSPGWHPNGHELFFLSRDSAETGWKMMAVPFVTTSPPRFGSPHELFAIPPNVDFWCFPLRCYDIALDGRFYATQAVDEKPLPPVTYINLIQNWFEVLKQKAPIK